MYMLIRVRTHIDVYFGISIAQIALPEEIQTLNHTQHNGYCICFILYIYTKYIKFKSEFRK